MATEARRQSRHAPFRLPVRRFRHRHLSLPAPLSSLPTQYSPSLRIPLLSFCSPISFSRHSFPTLRNPLPRGHSYAFRKCLCGAKSGDTGAICGKKSHLSPRYRRFFICRKMRFKLCKRLLALKCLFRRGKRGKRLRKTEMAALKNTHIVLRKKYIGLIFKNYQ